MPNNNTERLIKFSNGNQTVVIEISPLGYAELRRIAITHLRNERAGQTQQPTAPVHDAFLKAEVLQVSETTLKRPWRKAKAWFAGAIKNYFFALIAAFY